MLRDRTKSEYMGKNKTVFIFLSFNDEALKCATHLSDHDLDFTRTPQIVILTCLPLFDPPDYHFS